MSFSEQALLHRYPFQATQPLLVDVGAHAGYFSLAFARRGWRVIAFEPETENRAAFARNLAGLNHVTCIPNAVSNVSGERVPFYVSSEHYGIHALKPFHATHRPAYEVETVRVADALREHGATGVTLLKTDIEGADFLALQGCDFAAERPELVMVEFMDDRSQQNFGYTHHDMVAFMRERGYSAFVSEWAPISSYARKGEAGEPHTWLRCVPYPLDHTPAWGNLIFVPTGNEPIFKRTLQAYLRRTRLKDTVRQIPGAQLVYRLIKGR